MYTQKSGQVTRVNKRLGDRVAAGEAIAEIENAAERAALLSAQGGYEAAKASQSISATSAAGAETSLASAEAAARNTLASAYASVDNAVRTTADSMISNPESARPVFNIQSKNSQLPVNIVNKRIALSPVLNREANAPRNLAGTALREEIQRTQAEVRTALSLLDDLVGALNLGIATYDTTDAEIAAFLTSATGARTTLLATASGLTSALDSLDAKTTAVEIAQKSSESGGSTEVTTSQAAVKQAEGALAAARANYEKSIIRSPISGTLNALHISRGDFVQMNVPAAEVANNGALEVVTQVTEADAREIIVGTKVSLDKNAVGVVTRVAPAISSITRKIEVRIGITEKGELTSGDSVSVTFERGGVAGGNTAPLSRIVIPITSLKVSGEGMSVLMPGENNVLISRTVIIGTLLGDKVQILDGILPTESIIEDARGLRAGDTVEIN
ncbi:MAG: efflux RND transporter periplasmic adaptor subunit [Parcubacteria group bacterium]|nr:efflux RND transporter periplasmic adaptor subunit [Parcubacteria group bacterium]